MLSRALVLVLLCLGLDARAAAKDVWVTAEEYADFLVVLSDNALEVDYWAARRFVLHWERMTGHKISISRHPSPDKINVWIGQADNPFISPKDLEGLGTDGYLARTISGGVRGRRKGDGAFPPGKHLLLVGGGPRGTIFGEFDFFKRVAGVRVFVPRSEVWPEPPESILQIDYRWIPEIEYRDISYRTFVQGSLFTTASFLNGHWSHVPAGWGGRTAYLRGDAGFGHTFHYYVDPDEYYDEHPEYFAEIGGRRVKNAQLCLTNEDVLAITIEKVSDLLRGAAEDERIVSVSQMDYFWSGSWCACTNCRAIDEREKSHSGTIIHFVNRVAEAIAEEFPEAYVDTFAYRYSRRPPKHLRPRDNVIVRLCDIECDFSRPLSDRRSPRNRSFARDLKKWSRITENLHIWDYTQNWFSFQGPHPNIHVLQPNIEFFAKHDVKGVFEQASVTSPHSDFELLKGYILSMSLWDPHVDWRELYREFVDGYYREAAPFIDEYFDLITERVKRDDVVLSFLNPMEWMDYDLVERAQEIFGRAFAFVEDEEVLERLRYAYLPVQYAALVCAPRVYAGEEAYILTRPPSQIFDEYWAMLMDYGVTHLNDYPIDRFWERLNGMTPPRYEVVDVEKLRNEHVEFWVLPSKGASVVRLLDRRSGRDFLTGYKDILSVRGNLREWAAGEDGGGAGPAPVEQVYEVAERGEGYIVVRTTLENGLELRREMRLAPGAMAVDITLQVTNLGDEAVSPEVALYPEFSTAGLGKPQIWIERGGVWSKTALRRIPSLRVYREKFRAEGVGRWAFRFPDAQVTISSTVDSTAVESISYVYAPDAGSISMPQRIVRTELAPGEHRTFRTRFEFTTTKPKLLRADAPWSTTGLSVPAPRRVLSSH